jgi:hypothetical protein
MALDAGQMVKALASIQAWRIEPDVPAMCPACAHAGLGIIDRSTRPWAEWYVLTCAACGLDETIHMASAPPMN